jgi:uncharacterized membrane protein SpoIIM required for sporulation
MSSDRFITKRKNSWQRLEELLQSLESIKLRRLHRTEVRELAALYRRASSDLAIARAESRDPRLVSYLNNLVVRAHGRIYRGEAREGVGRVQEFFASELPRTFRRTWRYTALAFLVFTFFFTFAIVATTRDPSFATLSGIDPSDANFTERIRWWETLNDANQLGASQIGTNNIGVTFLAFALGASAGVGTLFVLAFNGAMIGSVLALTYRAGFGNELVAFMVGHGVVELSCIFFAGGAGLLIGSAILLPGDLSRADALRSRGREAVTLIIGCIPLLVIAGTIEGFISPAPISPWIKYAIGITTGVLLYAYLLSAGNDERGVMNDEQKTNRS